MQKAKIGKTSPEFPLKLKEQVNRPFQQTNMDLFTIKGTTFLTVIDAFMKLAQAYQVSSKNAIEICKPTINLCPTLWSTRKNHIGLRTRISK